MDPTNEFGLESHPDKLNCRNENFWTRGFAFRENFNFPCFLNGIEDQLLLCGKSLTLLRICNPTHFLITNQSYLQLRMKLCLNARVIREYTSYWENYKNETTEYLNRLKEREEKERKQIEIERTEAILELNKEKRQIAKEYKLKQQRIATEQKQKLMADLQEQIEEKKRYKIEQLEKEKELDAYYASKSGSIVESGVETSGLIEEVKKDIEDKYAALEQEAMKKLRLAEEKKRFLAEKMGIIEQRISTLDPDTEIGADISENLPENLIQNASLLNNEVSTILNIPQDEEIALDFQQQEILIESKIDVEKDILELLPLKPDFYEIVEEIDTEIMPQERELLIPIEKDQTTEPIISATPSSKKENFYFSLQKCYDECSLIEEDPLIEVNEALRLEYKEFIAEQESFTNYPISELVKRSYFFPVQTQARIVNIFILHYFRNSLQLDNHFTILRKFVMMENGEFGDSLSMQIFNLLYLPDRPQYFFHLNLILERALIASRSEKLPQIENLVLGYREQENILVATTNKKSSESQPLITDELSNIVLDYNVEWPMNVVLREFTIKTCYTKIFNFLMYVKRSVWCLNVATSNLKSLQDRLMIPNQHALNQIKVLHLYRHEMQHFVTVLQNYLANQVLKVSWASFQTRLNKVENLEELYIEHWNYVNHIMTNMVLNTKGKPINIAIKKIFFYIFRFYTHIQESHWIENESTLNNFEVLHAQYNYYKKFTDFVCTLITKLIKNGYSSQLEYLILLIDYNGYFAIQNFSRVT